MAFEWLSGLGDWLGGWFQGGGEAARGFSAADIAAGAAEGAPAATAAAAPAWSFADVAKGIWDPVSKGVTGLGQVAKTVLPIAQLGAGVMGGLTSYKAAGEMGEQAKGARESQQLQQEMARQTAGAAAPLTQFGTRELGRAEAGQLPPAIEQRITLWIQGAKQKVHDYLARAGQGDSSTLKAWDAWIDLQAEAARAAAIQDQERIAIGSLQAGAGALAGAGGQAGAAAGGAEAQMQGLEALISQANQQLAALAGGAS